MSINDLLKTLDTSSGYSTSSGDGATTKRGQYDPAAGSEYRDKLARSVNAPQKSAPRPSESPVASEPKSAPHDSKDSRQPDASQNHAKPVEKASPPQAREATESVSTAEVPAADSTGGSGGSEIVATEVKATVESESETEAPIDGVSEAALSLLTITAAAPVSLAINVDVPNTPTGVHELLDATSSHPTSLSIPPVSVTDAAPPQPPAGLVECFDLPRTNSTEVSALPEPQTIPAVIDPQSIALTESGNVEEPVAILQTPSRESLETISANLNVEAEKPSLGVAPEQTQRPSEASPMPGPESDATSAAAVAASALKPSDEAPAQEVQTKVRNQEYDAGADATTVTEGLKEASSGDKEPSDRAPMSDNHSQSTSKPRSNAGIALQSITDIITTELIVDEGQSTLEARDGGAIDPSSNPSVNLSSNSGSTSSGSHGTNSVTNAAAAGKMTHQQAQQLVDRVSNALHQSAQSGQSLKVRLSPPELGVLQIEVTQRDGILSARLEAQTGSAQQVLMDNLPSLREALAQSGTVVERIEVHVAQNRGSDNQSDTADHRQQHTDQQDQQQHRRDEPRQENKQKNEPHLRKGVRSMDQLDIQI